MTSAKIQRWTDLLVGLLRHRLGATFTELADDVPAYALPKRPTDREKAAVKRMFERDKAEPAAVRAAMCERLESMLAAGLAN